MREQECSLVTKLPWLEDLERHELGETDGYGREGTVG
jgi:hypothetical protein